MDYYGGMAGSAMEAAKQQQYAQQQSQQYTASTYPSPSQQIQSESHAAQLNRMELGLTSAHDRISNLEKALEELVRRVG
jgi:hypothetical protein